jgi:copper chaperone CopZ
MTHYVHHVPGRLRVKNPFLKRNERQAELVLNLLDSIDGIEKTDVNLITGSIVITYDKSGLNADNILDVLTKHGFTSVTQVPTGSGDALSHAFANAGQGISKVIFGMMVEKALERSATALIGAIL